MRGYFTEYEVSITCVALWTSIVPGGYLVLPKGVGDTAKGDSGAITGGDAVDETRPRPAKRLSRPKNPTFFATDVWQKCRSSLSSQISSPFHTTWRLRMAVLLENGYVVTHKSLAGSSILWGCPWVIT